MKIHPTALLALSAAFGASPAGATFPVQPIDCALFDLEDPAFLGANFGFATGLSYDDFSNPVVTTGHEGFFATPDQVAAIPEFAAGVDLPTGGHTLADLFPAGVGQPPAVREAEIGQSIRGEGDFVDGFTEVTISQRKRLSASQESGEFANLFAEGKAFAPFEVVAEGDGPVQAALSVDLFSTFNFSGGGSLSEFLGVALVDLTDPANPAFMDGVSGFYFVDDEGVFAGFGLGEEGEQDVSDQFFSGPSGAETDDPHLASFFYTIETQLTPGATYGLGLLGDGSVGVDGASTSWLDSSNTLTGTIEVTSPGARLYLPGLVVPEPATIGLACLGFAGLLARRSPPAPRT